MDFFFFMIFTTNECVIIRHFDWNHAVYFLSQYSSLYEGIMIYCCKALVSKTHVTELKNIEITIHPRFMIATQQRYQIHFLRIILPPTCNFTIMKSIKCIVFPKAMSGHSFRGLLLQDAFMDWCKTIFALC